jgi:CheY-like chemotaxis protein
MTKTQKIMIVDDEADIRETLSYFFQSRGYETIECHDGLHAWECLNQSTAPSIVLLDLTMPRMNGHQLLDRLKNHQELKKIPVIVVSALADTIEETPGIAAIKKPFSLEQLHKLISTHTRIDSIEKMI